MEANATVVIIDTFVGQFAYEIMAVLISVTSAYLAKVFQVFIKTASDKYGFDNDAAERLLANAIAYGKKRTEGYVADLTTDIGHIDNEIIKEANEYLKIADKNKLIIHSDALEAMLIRKMAQDG